MPTLRDRFREALQLVTLSELGRGTRRSRPTWEAYKYGRRRVTREAALELVQYLRERSVALNEAAERLEAATAKEGEDE